MKFKSFVVLMLSCFMIATLPSCQSDNNKKTKSTKTSKKAAKKTLLTPEEYWAKAKDNLGLTDAQIKSIKAANTKYANQAKSLKKAKKWDPKKSPQIIQKAKSAEYKKILGNKLKLWQDFNQKNAIKTVKKKTTKKKSSKKTGAKKKAKK